MSTSIPRETRDAPSTHQALRLNSTRDPYDISVTTIQIPTAGPGSAVLRILAAGVLTYADRVYSGRKPYPYPEPFVPGSSAVGRVVAVGQDATRLVPGQLVYFDSFVRGRDDPSNALMLHGLSSGFGDGGRKLMEGEWRDGTYAQYAKVPLENCFPLNEGRLMGSPEAGGFAYTVEDLMYLSELSVPFGGLRDVRLQAGEKIIIAPATGTFGSAAVMAALAIGARVVAVSRDLEALRRLKEALGPEARIEVVQNTGDVQTDTKQLTKDGPADVFFDISPGKAATSTHFKSAIDALGRGGRVSLMGAHLELMLPVQTIMLRNITVKGKWMYEPNDIRTLIKLVELGYLKLGAAAGIKTVGAFSLQDFKEAFDAAAAVRGPWQHVVIVP